MRHFTKGKIKGKTGAAALALCLLAAGGLAQSAPMTDYAPGQQIDVGFARPASFLSGCTLPGGENFVVVGTDFNDAYLVQRTGQTARDAISGGIPVAEGDGVEVTAEDENRCEVRIYNARESRTYAYALETTPYGYERWMLTGYGYRDERTTFSAQVDLECVQAVETTQAGTQTYTTYYAFYAEAMNFDYGEMPSSIAELKRLEKAHPLAAVSPSDPTSRVNLRKSPSTKSSRVGSLYSGTRLWIRELTDDGWAKVFVGDMAAYIRTDFLTFGEAIGQVTDARPTAKLPDQEFVDVSRQPYRGGGGTATRMCGGRAVRVLGEYNGEWRIVQTEDMHHAFFIEAGKLH